MKDFVINPMWVYWLSVVNGLKCMFVTLGCIFIVVLIIELLYIEFEKDYWVFMTKDKGKKETERFCKIFLCSCVITCLMFAASIFVPSKRTLIEMEVAKHMTYSNIEIAKGEIKDVVDYVFDKLDKLDEDE